MLTGMLAVKNVVLGEQHDLWAVNVDQAYQEEIQGDVEPDEFAAVVENTLTRVFNKLDGLALDLALGPVTGIARGLTTVVQALGGPHVLSGYLWLLSQYLPRYRVSLAGSAWASRTAWPPAPPPAGASRNAMMALYLTNTYGRAEKRFLRHLFDYL